MFALGALEAAAESSIFLVVKMKARRMLEGLFGVGVGS